jgi:hypothetical protein
VLDQSVQDLALSLRNHLADPLLVAISQLSRWQVTLLSSAAVFFWLYGARQTLAAWHWLVAIGGGWLMQLLLAWGLRAAPQVMDVSSELLRSPSSAMSLTTVVFCFFAVMMAREVRRKHRQWPYLAAGLIITLLLLSRLYLGLEWLSGALMGIFLGLAWTLVVGMAYRQRAMQPFSGALAGLIFYGSASLLFLWQVNEHTGNEVAALHAVVPSETMAEQYWWNGGWQELPTERTRAFSVASRRFNAQVLVEPDDVAAALEQEGWERVPDTDWLWLIQALNPEPDQASLPLLGRAYQGRTEALLMKRISPTTGQLVTIRLWDSGVRLQPGMKVLYLAQISEELLEQRFGLFSYWRSRPYVGSGLESSGKSLSSFEQQQVSEDMLLLR